MYFNAGIPLILPKASITAANPIGIERVIAKVVVSVLKNTKQSTPATATKPNCFKVRGPIILSSTSINCGT